MAIKPPNHAKNAIPTKRGWEHPRTGELLIARRHTQSQIDEYLGIEIAPPPPPAPEPVEFIEVNEDDVVVDDAIEMITLSDDAHEEGQDHTNCHGHEEPDDLNDLNKKQLEEVGREHGIELDRREKKSTLIEKLRAVISK